MRFSHRLLRVLCLLLVFIPIHFAVQPAAAQGQRPALEILLWGDRFFPYPEWRLRLEESPDSTVGSWLDCCSVVSYKRWNGFSNLPLAQVASYVTSEWIAVTLSGYADHRITRQCVVQNRVHFEAIGVFRQKDYMMKYWLWSDERSLAEVFVAWTLDESDARSVMSVNTVQERIRQIFGDGRTCADDPVF